MPANTKGKPVGKTVGRKPLPESQKKTEVIPIKVTRKDKRLFRQYAEACGLSLGAYLRRAARESGPRMVALIRESEPKLED